MAINKKISIRNAITELIDSTSESYLNMLPTLVTWAKKADLDIGTPYQYERKFCTRSVVDYKAELPLSVVYVTAVIAGDHFDDGLSAFNAEYTSVQKDTITANGQTVVYSWDNISNMYRCRPLLWEVVDNHIVFPSDFNDDKITVLYYGYFVDSEGLPMINENNIDAIATFLKLKIAKKEQFNKFRKLRLSHVDNNFINSLAKEWKIKKRAARADSDPIGEDWTRELSEILNHPFSGDGMLRDYIIY